MEKLSIEEAGKYLGMSGEAVRGLIRSGALPADTIAGQLCVDKEILQDWVMAEAANLKPNDLAALQVAQEHESLCVSNMLKKNNILINLFATTKSEVIEKLVSRMATSYKIKSKKALLDAVRKREMLCSTAVARGIALPHPRRIPRQRFRTPRMVMGISRGGIDFESEDGSPTHVFALFCAPRDDIHLRILAKLGRLLRDYRLVLRLCAAETEDEALRIFREAEDEDAARRNLKLVPEIS